MTNASKTIQFSDMHIHLQDDRFGRGLEEVEAYVNSAREVGVTRLVCSGTSPADWNRTAELGRRFDGVYATFGIHPWYVGKVSGDWIPVLTELLVKYVAKDGVTRAFLGEVGLDFAVRDLNPNLQVAQETTLRSQLNLAAQLRLPVVLHSVRANAKVLSIMREYPKVPAWLLHGWTATKEEIEQAVDLGVFFSFSSRGVSTTAVRARATVAAVPRDRVLLESDGPQLVPPRGYAGTPVDFPPILLERRAANGMLVVAPAGLIETAREVAAIRGVKLDEFFEQLELNEKRFFRSVPKHESA